MSKKGHHKGLLVVLALVCAGLAGYACWQAAQADEGEAAADYFVYVVGSQSGEAVEDVVRARGILECAETIPAVAKIRGRLTELLPEGTPVRKGDVLFKIDDTLSRETIESTTTSLANVDLDLVRLEAQFQLTDFQESQGILLNGARLKHAQLEEQEELQLPKARARRLMDIDEELAKLDVEDAEDEYQRELRMFKKGYISASALESVEQRLANARASLSELKLENELSKKGVTDERRVELRMAVERAASRKSRAEARKRRRVGTIRANQESERKERARLQYLLDYHTQELDKAVTVSPIDGVFMVSTYRDWTTGGTLKSVAIGDEKYANDIVGRVMNPGKVEVRLAVHESDYHRLHEGLPVEVVLPAVENRRYQGTLAQLGAIGRDRNHVDPTGILGGDSEISMFNAVVKMDTSGESFHPGMSALVKIRLRAHQDELLIPRAALSGGYGSAALQVRMRGGEMRPVTGRYFNSMYFAVESGLKRGEEIEISNCRGAK